MPFFQPFVGFYSPISEELFNDVAMNQPHERPSAEEYTRGTPQWPHAYPWNVPHHEVVPRGAWQVLPRYTIGGDQVAVREGPRGQKRRHHHRSRRHGHEHRDQDDRQGHHHGHHHGHRHGHRHGTRESFRGRDNDQEDDVGSVGTEDVSSWIAIAMQNELARRRAAERQIYVAREIERRRREQEALKVKQQQEEAIRLRLERLHQAQVHMIERARMEWAAENAIDPFNQLVEALSGLQTRVLLSGDSEPEDDDSNNVRQQQQQQQQQVAEDNNTESTQSPVVFLRFGPNGTSEVVADDSKPSVEEPESPAPEPTAAENSSSNRPDNDGQSTRNAGTPTVQVKYLDPEAETTTSVEGDTKEKKETQAPNTKSSTDEKQKPKDLIQDQWAEVQSVEILLKLRQELGFVGSALQRIAQNKADDLRSTKSQLSVLGSAYAQAEEIYTKLDSLSVPREQRKAKHDLTASAVDLAEKLESLIAIKLRWRDELKSKNAEESDSDSDISVVSDVSNGSTESKKHHVVLETVADDGSI